MKYHSADEDADMNITRIVTQALQYLITILVLF